MKCPKEEVEDHLMDIPSHKQRPTLGKPDNLLTPEPLKTARNQVHHLYSESRINNWTNQNLIQSLQELFKKEKKTHIGKSKCHKTQPPQTAKCNWGKRTYDYKPIYRKDTANNLTKNENLRGYQLQSWYRDAGSCLVGTKKRAATRQLPFVGRMLHTQGRGFEDPEPFPHTFSSERWRGLLLPILAKRPFILAGKQLQFSAKGRIT